MPSEERSKQISPLRRALMLHVVPLLVLGLIRLLSWTWRYRETDREHLDQCLADERPPIMGFFHGRTFILLPHMTRPGNGRWIAMTSQSLDGEVVARVQERLGVEVVRGSSGRGGMAALQKMIRRVRSSANAGGAIAVDGSRGPRGRVQGGIVTLARWTGGRILPITAAARPAWIFRRAWDRTLLPKPFARVDIVYGRPVEVPAKMSSRQAAALSAEVEEQMVALQHRANALSGFGDDQPVRAPAAGATTGC